MAKLPDDGVRRAGDCRGCPVTTPVLFGLTGPDGRAVYVRSDAIVACRTARPAPGVPNGVGCPSGDAVGAPAGARTLLQTTVGPLLVAEPLEVLVRMLRATGLGIVAQRAPEPVEVTPCE